MKVLYRNSPDAPYKPKTHTQQGAVEVTELHSQSSRYSYSTVSTLVCETVLHFCSWGVGLRSWCGVGGPGGSFGLEIMRFKS